MEAVKINTAEIPGEVYDAGCRILSKSVRVFFDDPKNRRGYEAWHQTPEGQRADLTKKERDEFDKLRYLRKSI